jgi:hypothetical protein
LELLQHGPLAWRLMVWVKDRQQTLDRIQGGYFPSTQALPAALAPVRPGEWIEVEGPIRGLTPTKTTLAEARTPGASPGVLAMN